MELTSRQRRMISEMDFERRQRFRKSLSGDRQQLSGMVNRYGTELLRKANNIDDIMNLSDDEFEIFSIMVANPEFAIESAKKLKLRWEDFIREKSKISEPAKSALINIARSEYNNIYDYLKHAASSFGGTTAGSASPYKNPWIVTPNFAPDHAVIAQTRLAKSANQALKYAKEVINNQTEEPSPWRTDTATGRNAIYNMSRNRKLDDYARLIGQTTNQIKQSYKIESKKARLKESK